MVYIPITINIAARELSRLRSFWIGQEVKGFPLIRTTATTVTLEINNVQETYDLAAIPLIAWSMPLDDFSREQLIPLLEAKLGRRRPTPRELVESAIGMLSELKTCLGER